MALFALDEGFPDTVFAVAGLLPEVDLRPLRDVDDRLLGNADDWAILLRLFQHPEPFDGLITVDASMTRLVRELVVLHQTQLSLVVFEDVGNDPVRASGLCLLHLPHIAKQTEADKPQLWILRPPGRKSPIRARDRLGELASAEGASIEQLMRRERLGSEQIERDLWSWYTGIDDEY